MSTSPAPSEGAWPLRTARLTLRPHRSDDADPLQRIYGQADVAREIGRTIDLGRRSRGPSRMRSTGSPRGSHGRAWTPPPARSRW